MLEIIRELGYKLILAPTNWKKVFSLADYVRGGQSGRFCASSTDLCIEGFMSSANTFAFNALYCVRPDLDIARHKHVVANLKRAVEHEVPTVILFRDPDDCIPSAVSRFRPSLAEAIQRYLYFYQYVVDEMKSDILLVSFEEMTQEVEATIRRISSFAAFDVDTDRLEGVEERAKERIRCRTKRREKTTERISLPKEEREKKKNKIREELVRHSKYEDVRDLYCQVQDLHKKQGQHGQVVYESKT